MKVLKTQGLTIYVLSSERQRRNDQKKGVDRLPEYTFSFDSFLNELFNCIFLLYYKCINNLSTDCIYIYIYTDKQNV